MATVSSPAVHLGSSIASLLAAADAPSSGSADASSLSTECCAAAALASIATNGCTSYEHDVEVAAATLRRKRSAEFALNANPESKGAGCAPSSTKTTSKGEGVGKAVLASPPAVAGAPPRKRRTTKKTNRRCNACGVAETPKWRRDPTNAAVVLCNACGLKKKNIARNSTNLAKRGPTGSASSAPGLAKKPRIGAAGGGAVSTAFPGIANPAVAAWQTAASLSQDSSFVPNALQALRSAASGWPSNFGSGATRGTGSSGRAASVNVAPSAPHPFAPVAALHNLSPEAAASLASALAPFAAPLIYGAAPPPSFMGRGMASINALPARPSGKVAASAQPARPLPPPHKDALKAGPASEAASPSSPPTSKAELTA